MTPQENTHAANQKFSRRLSVIFWIVVMLCTVVVVRLLFIMGGVQTDLSQPAAERSGRGTINDRNGRILGIQTNLDTVSAWTPNVTDPAVVARHLSDILSIDINELLARLTQPQRYFVIARSITLTQSSQIQQLIDGRMIDGITLSAIPSRVYPEKNTASTLLGYVGTEGNGLGGIEYSFNDTLHPAKAGVDSGHTIYLTIDIVLQSFVEQVALEALETERANNVIAIVMNAQTGEILASVSVPNFNPNAFADYSASSRNNRVISKIYEPGSVFKIFTIAIFLDYGSITLFDFFDTSTRYAGTREQYEITDLGDYGIINTQEIIVRSSNVGAALASDTLSRAQLYQKLLELGFGSKSGLGISGEEEGLFRSVDEWTERTKPTIAIGQEIGVTAIQIAQAATAIANQGVLLQPYIIKQVVAVDGSIVQRSEPTQLAQVLSPQTTRSMLTMMNAATRSPGTASLLTIDDINISAKTGTAEVFDSELNEYSTEHFIPSTLAIFPTEDPQYIVYMAIDYPQGSSIYGGRIVAPRVKQISDYIIAYLGLDIGSIRPVDR